MEWKTPRFVSGIVVEHDVDLLVGRNLVFDDVAGIG
jgi:hypothetical protein